MRYFDFDKDDPKDLTSGELEALAESIKGWFKGLLCAGGIMVLVLGVVYLVVKH